jgi:hypothetical protein
MERENMVFIEENTFALEEGGGERKSGGNDE